MPRASFHAVLLVAVCALWPAVVRAEPVALPVELDCAGKQLDFDLHDSQLEVVFDAEATPHLSIVDLLRPQNEDGLVIIDDQQSILLVSQPHGAERSAPKLLVKLRLAPGTLLSVRGENVTASIELFGAPELPPLPMVDLDGTSVPEPDAAPPPAAAAPKLKLDFASSSVRVVGLAATIHGTGTSYTIENGQGLLKADLSGGRLVVDGFAGIVDVRADGAQLELARVAGSLQYNATNSALTLSIGSGAVRGAGAGSDLRVTGWAGGVVHTGSAGRIEVLESGGPGAVFQLGSAGGDVQVEHVRGNVSLDQDGGRVTLKTINGDSSVTARGSAEVKVEAVKGKVDLQLSENSTALVQGAGQGLNAKTEGGRLELTGAKDTSLNVTATAVTAKGLTGRADVRARDADLELEMSGVTSNLKFDLGGTTRARATLGMPCFVLLDGAAETDNRLTVSGCDTEEQRKRGVTPPRFGGTRAPVIASTKLSDGATLDIVAR